MSNVADHPEHEDEHDDHHHDHEDEHDHHHDHEGGIPTLVKVAIIILIAATAAVAGYLAR